MNIVRIISLLLILSVVSCKTKYATKEFIYSEAPKSPDYSELNSWAAHPEKNDSIIDAFYNTEKKNLKADVFYIYPTLLTDNKNDSWNSDVKDNNQNSVVRNVAIKYLSLIHISEPTRRS